MPVTNKKLRKKVYPVSINPTVIEDFDKIASENSRSRSNQAELAFMEYIERHKQTT